MRKDNSNFQTAFLSEAGSQLENHDYFGYVELDDYACWVIADGIDDDEASKSAEMVVKHVLSLFEKEPGFSKRQLKKYLTEAHELLQRESHKMRLKASVMIVVTNYMTFRFATAGNIHLRVISKNQVTLASKDQSYYQQKLDEGFYPLDRTIGFEERNNLTNYVGTPERFNPFVSKKHKLQEMDIVTLLTVGVWEQVDDIELLDATVNTTEPQEVADHLEDVLLSKQKPTLENYTIGIIFVNKLYLQEKIWWPLIKRVLMIMIPLLFILGILLFMQYRSEQNRLEVLAQIQEYDQLGDQHIQNRNYRRALEAYNEAIQLFGDVKDETDETLILKRQLTELLVDGLASLEKDDLEEAQNFFVSARDLWIDHEQALLDFELGFILNQLNLTNTRMYIEDLLQLGDVLMQANQLESSIETYEKAKEAAIGIGHQPSIQLADVKLGTAIALLDAQHAEEADAEAEAARASADQEAAEVDQLAALDPEKAAEQYDAIAKQYEEAGFPELAAQMRAKAEQLRADVALAEFGQQREVALQFEAKGDEALSDEDYEGAIAYFQSAERIFRSLNATPDVQSIGQKITATQNLIQARSEQEEARKREAEQKEMEAREADQRAAQEAEQRRAEEERRKQEEGDES